MAEAGGRVDFDFDGALALARKLYSLGEDLDTRRSNRRSNAETARNKWEGPLVSEFNTRESDEHSDARRIANQLRDEAGMWAQAWADAMDQQNKNNRMAEVQRIRDDRGFWEKSNDTLNPWAEDDSDDKVPMPDYPPVPTPPSFAPTATEVTY